MKFLHTADWQLGCSFARFGEKGAALREQRVHTLRRALETAAQEQVDAFIVAGDLFEDNQVGQGLLGEVCALLGEFRDVRIFIVPGNHDPASGPGSIWERAPFRTPPGNVTVFTSPRPVEVRGGWLLANPLQQKQSTRDPSAELGRLAQSLSAESLKVGITHGALAIEGRHQPDDHPVALDAASRNGLDYLALGHWHSWLVCDNGRLVMPGTPEPDNFGQPDSGHGALVELAGPGQEPKIRKLPLAGLTWRELVVDLQQGDPARQAALADLDSLAAQAERHVIRVVLSGYAARQTRAETLQLLKPRLGRLKAAELCDESRLAWNEAELAAVRQEHPLLARIIADLARIRVLATGQSWDLGEAENPLTSAEYRELLQDLELDPGFLDEAFFKAAADLLAAKLQEVSA